MTNDTCTTEQPQLLTDRLLVWAGGRTPGERAAVIALIDEDDLLTRRDVQQLLITDTGTTLHCDWPRFESRYRTTLTLDDGEDAFLTLVIATAFPRLVALWKVEALGRRRLAIILRAVEHVAATDATVQEPT
ncbi:hypothetical protein GT204_16830 [Streptomyces sp. SID4919]|uniref:hypothetical protein n=1 Tax=unclassified Streptomyces TaxID=2593676 RepID=UPI000823AD7F|nr:MULTISPECIES: hypothetical protein [unclassified Streptomyces]MYY10525.1 hypothetical protein [Streptomyces sp. SID4919]SCK47150.1 hypothetical protein YW7DRAFT_04203 [Streptomyces sp. AmelKG-E11A]